MLQFGKTSSSKFAIDFRYPLSPIQAFGIALTAFAVQDRNIDTVRSPRRAEYDGSAALASAMSGRTSPAATTVSDGASLNIVNSKSYGMDDLISPFSKASIRR